MMPNQLSEGARTAFEESLAEGRRRLRQGDLDGAKGAKAGTMTIDGKVDQGSSSNKTMSLAETLEGYSDDGKLIYDTDAPASLDMKLSKVPDGTLEGSLSGVFALTGELEGVVTLSLSFTRFLEPAPDDATQVRRKAGTTHITGTATSDFGAYEVDITR